MTDPTLLDNKLVPPPGQSPHSAARAPILGYLSALGVASLAAPFLTFAHQFWPSPDPLSGALTMTFGILPFTLFFAFTLTVIPAGLFRLALAKLRWANPVAFATAGCLGGMVALYASQEAWKPTGAEALTHGTWIAFMVAGGMAGVTWW